MAVGLRRSMVVVDYVADRLWAWSLRFAGLALEFALR
jgi:hypothetical protein